MLPDVAARGHGTRDVWRSEPMAYVLAALGGALGALARWAVAEAIPVPPGGWPWATLLVNLIGCGLLGALLDVLAEWFPRASWPRPFVAVGVLGGFTTYSTFAVELVDLVRSGALVPAAGYLLVSVVGGLLAVAAGALVVRRIAGGMQR